MVAACATTDAGLRPQAGYWSKVEDYGANPPPGSEMDDGPEGTFYPYVQSPIAMAALAATAAIWTG